MTTSTVASGARSAIADHVTGHRAHGTPARHSAAVACALFDETASTADYFISIRGGTEVGSASLCRTSDVIVVDRALTRC
jgi:hypothetical protein